jgi:hypothetical protein
MAWPQCDTPLVKKKLIENIQDIYNTWALHCCALLKTINCPEKCIDFEKIKFHSNENV